MARPFCKYMILFAISLIKLASLLLFNAFCRVYTFVFAIKCYLTKLMVVLLERCVFWAGCRYYSNFRKMHVLG